MQQLSIFMYKVKNRLVPDYLCDMFTNQPRTQGFSSWGEKTLGTRWSRDMLKSSRFLIGNPR